MNSLSFFLFPILDKHLVRISKLLI